ncbi:hypothetical protein [Terracoccus luteus]|uniref:Bacteriocin biosynthesis cyclodehydratase domain-containing protein n=1 Tax=Terracoccus luteus TaxID=53356 RepID=A0A839PYI3_9MICO|nr:hypothetical protein [Terracoccus luteus]MBB2985832.1 hypothetical protein [Terracoccus luteus]MCP2171484.1 hypothetical protein [Terracoccus luteus]
MTDRMPGGRPGGTTSPAWAPSPGSRAHIPGGLRPLVRAPGEVQFGLTARGPIVSGLTTAEIGLLSRLDGRQAVAGTFRDAADAGVAAARWHELLDLLRRLEVLRVAPADDGPLPVGIEGEGPLADSVSRALRRTGLVPVPSRPGAAPAPPVEPAPVLVVLVGSPAVDPRRGDPWLAAGVPHLPVSPGGGHATVGPLVSGRRHPCLWCLDRHRSDRDAAWPTVMAQAATPAPAPFRALGAVGVLARPPASGPLGHAGVPPGSGDVVDPALADVVAGSVAAIARSLVDGHRPPPGVSVDVCLPWPRMDHRRWQVHPACDRHGAAPADTDSDPDSDPGSTDAAPPGLARRQHPVGRGRAPHLV